MLDFNRAFDFGFDERPARVLGSCRWRIVFRDGQVRYIGGVK